MAFSMFLRAPACSSRIMGQQMSRLVTSSVLAPRMLATQSVTSMFPAKSFLLKEAQIKTTPLMNALRPFSTSMATSAAAADGPAEEHPHDHAKLWVIEKYTTAAITVLIPLGLLLPNRIVDLLLCVLITAHSHWGLEAIAVDYVRASIFGPFIPKMAIALVYLLSIATLGGLLYLISHDVGLCAGIRQLWSVKAQQKS